MWNQLDEFFLVGTVCGVILQFCKNISKFGMNLVEDEK